METRSELALVVYNAGDSIRHHRIEERQGAVMGLAGALTFKHADESMTCIFDRTFGQDLCQHEGTQSRQTREVTRGP